MDDAQGFLAMLTESEARDRLIKFVEDWGLHEGICDMQLMVGAGESLPESNDPEVIESEINRWRQTPGAKFLATTLTNMGYQRGWVVIDGTQFPGFIK